MPCGGRPPDGTTTAPRPSHGGTRWPTPPATAHGRWSGRSWPSTRSGSTRRGSARGPATRRCTRRRGTVPTPRSSGCWRGRPAHRCGPPTASGRWTSPGPAVIRSSSPLLDVEAPEFPRGWAGPAIETYLHALMVVRARRFGIDRPLRLPPVDAVVELAGRPLWCPVAGMYGGFSLTWQGEVVAADQLAADLGRVRSAAPGGRRRGGAGRGGVRLTGWCCSEPARARSVPACRPAAMVRHQ